MREIKFRVWSKIKQRWVENMLLLACIDGLPFSHIVEVDEESNIRHHVYNASGLELIVQQYTGLKDKNGKEVYEGDFIKYEHPSDEQVKLRNTSNIVLVRWTEEHHDHHPGFITNDLWGQYGDFEVIGNTFENPELIKTEV